MNKSVLVLCLLYFSLAQRFGDTNRVPQVLGPSAQIIRTPSRAQDLEYPSQNKAFVARPEDSQLSQSIDYLLKWNITLCSTCQSLKYLAIKLGTNAVGATDYVTVSSSCSGTINFNPKSGPYGRPGNDQLFISTQLQDDTWLLQPRNCPGKYIKAISATTLAVVSGISSNARFWIEYHQDHVHIQSGSNNNYWGGSTLVELSGGASRYMVEYWPTKPW